MKLTSAAMNTNQEPQRFPASGAAPCYVAALFVQPDGCYAGWPWIDAWDKERDAAIIREVPKLRAAIIADLTADVEPVAWLDAAIDWTATGKPITRRICIQAQCGDLALSYVESALRDTASTVAALKARVAELEEALREALPVIDQLRQAATFTVLADSMTEAKNGVRMLNTYDGQVKEHVKALRAALTKGQQ